MRSSASKQALFATGLIIFSLIAVFLNPFGSGNGPTTTETFTLPTGEVVSYETYYVHAFQDPGRDYQFYFQQTPSSPKERLGNKFPGPGDPIPLKNVKIYRFKDRWVLVIDSLIFSKPDSYVFFHSLPFEDQTWKILYNKRDNFVSFDRIADDGKSLVTKGTTIGNDRLQYFVYKVSSEGELELDSERSKKANDSGLPPKL